MDRKLFLEINRMLEPLRRKAALFASRAVVQLLNDSLGMQGLQVSLLAGEAHDPEHMQPGGLSHVAGAGAEGIFLSIGGVRDDGVVICVSARGGRPKNLADGETCLYSTGGMASRVHLKANGDVVILAANAVLIGDAAAQAMVKGNALSTWLAAHTHPTAMGPSGPPAEGGTLSTVLSAKHKLDG